MLKSPVSGTAVARSSGLASYRLTRALQLERILRAYFPEREQMGGGTLLFPPFRTGQEAMLTDIRNSSFRP